MTRACIVFGLLLIASEASADVDIGGLGGWSQNGAFGAVDLAYSPQGFWAVGLSGHIDDTGAIEPFHNINSVLQDTFEGQGSRACISRIPTHSIVMPSRDVDMIPARGEHHTIGSIQAINSAHAILQRPAVGQRSRACVSREPADRIVIAPGNVDVIFVTR